MEDYAAMRVRLSVITGQVSGQPGEAVDVVVTAPEGTTVAEVAAGLRAAAGAGPDTRLWCGDTPLPDDAVLGEPPLACGALIGVGAPTPATPAPSGLQLRVVSGPAAGAVHLLGHGEARIGRAADATVVIDDLDVSRTHAELATGPDGVTVRDLGSSNGTSIDTRPVGQQPVPLPPGAMLRVGESLLSVVIDDDPAAAVKPDGAGHVDLNRPPRLHPPPPEVEVRLPVEPVKRDGMRLPLIAMVLPVLIAIPMAFILKSAMMLAFLVLSPLMLVGNWASDRLSGRRSYEKEMKRYGEELATAQRRIDAALADEVSLRRHDAPDPAALLLWALGPRPRLWERRRHDDDFLTLRLGTADLPSRIVVRRSGGGSDHVESPNAAAVPVTVSLKYAGVVGLAGPRPQLAGLARWALAQLAGLHSPRDLEVVLLAIGAHDEDWGWAAWLPHLTPVSGQDCSALLGLGPDQAAVRVAELVAQLEARQEAVRGGLGATREWAGRRTVVVLDGARALRALPGMARLLEEGPPVGIHALCLAEAVTELPAECDATGVVEGEVHTRLRVTVTAEKPIAEALTDQVSDAWAHRFARALAPLRDATPEGGEASLPDTARLLDLLRLDPPGPEAVTARWKAAGRSTEAVLGVGLDGPYPIDVRRDGPHGLVAGTTGSGKSELLQSLVASLAVANRPDEFCFVLIDYKGGAAFQDCVRLPHTVGMVTDLDGHLTERALASLDAELKRRELLLKDAGCKDIEAYQAAGSPAGPLARLMLVIDEFASLVGELPDFVKGLVDIARRGRSLGVHLVLATQRPGGVVSADIRANTNLRIALRVTDPAESLDVVDTKEAALISKATPGRAYVRTGAGGVTVVQTARVSNRSRRARQSSAAVSPQPWRTLGGPAPRVLEAGDVDGPTDLARLVEAIRTAADEAGIVPPPSPWLPPLPDVVSVGELPAGAAGSVAIGLTDLPAQQRREPFALDFEHGGHWLVVGGPRSGRTTLLRTVAALIARGCDVRDVHVYGLDCAAGGLLPLTALPHCGAIAGRDQAVRGDRMLTRLVAEVTRRQELLAQAGYGSVAEQRAAAAPEDRLPWLVLLIDGWEGFTGTYEAIDHGRPIDTLQRLLRDGTAAGLRTFITGDRGLLTARIGSVVPHRMVLRMSDRSDASLAGIRTRDVPEHQPPGRALIPVPEGVLETQIALLVADPSGPAQVAEVRRLGEEAAARMAVAKDTAAATDTAAGARNSAAVGVDGTGSGASDAPAGLPRALRPFKVADLPVWVSLDEVLADAEGRAGDRRLWALAGVGGDELDPMGVDLAEDGPAFVVAGPPRSGRSTTLVTMARWYAARGVPVVAVTPRRSPLRDVAGALGHLGPSDSGALSEVLAEHTGPLGILVDDAELLVDAPVEPVLVDLLRPGADHGRRAVIVAGSTEQMAATYRGLTVEARRGRCGLLLCPTGPLDGDLLGIKGARVTEIRPGRGFLAVHGQATPVQVPLAQNTTPPSS